jgi:hypothetical protein
MAHAQKPYFIFRRNGRVHLNRLGAPVQSTTGSRSVRISGSNAGYTMFRGSVKSTGYPLHSPVFPSLSLPCVTLCHYISTGVYKEYRKKFGSTTGIILVTGMHGAGFMDGIEEINPSVRSRGFGHFEMLPECLTFGRGLGVSITPLPLSTPGKTRYPFYRKLGGP